MGAYDQLAQLDARVVGLDADPVNVKRQREVGRDVLYADAEDPDLWARLDLGRIAAILLALPDLEAKSTALAQLAARRFPGLVSATAVFPDEAATLRAQGAKLTFNYYDRAGESFARRTWERLAGEGAPVVSPRR